MLRVEKSVDHYVSVSAGYERSCFGMSLEELVTLTQPVAETALPTLSGEEAQFAQQGGANASGVAKLSIPKELWRLVDALWASSALREKDLFNTPGVPGEAAAIRASLDRGLELPSCSPHSLVDALLGFVASLSRPLLPPELYPNVRKYEEISWL